ncbi:hypothetical protein OUZ56_031898 [Daphnia magna]|uniref:Uncharacterized protein n=1 Tax=Daphnia magna TaxID=35525 RepID=A0ABQ9ZVJ3_9CRUS|nr:hypothetical protein OUZ56_031898 [Daphnia magna]
MAKGAVFFRSTSTHTNSSAVEQDIGLQGISPISPSKPNNCFLQKCRSDFNTEKYLFILISRTVALSFRAHPTETESTVDLRNIFFVC